MKYQNVQNAVTDAYRFVEKAEKLLALTEKLGTVPDTVIQGSVSASTRRASHDLSRSLAEMRKSDWGE